jgi:glycosyltransferase involved in cell wall biosynthesis
VRVLFLIRALQRGGAERQLVTLVRGLDPARFEVTLATFYDGCEFAEELRGLGHVRVVSVGKRGRWDVLGFLGRLYRLARETRPQVLHGYMYGANELALLLGRAVRARVVWGIRASELQMRHYDLATRLLYRTGAWLAARADALIANSQAGRRFHIALGYPVPRFLVIPNGIDTECYRPDAAARMRVRAAWGVTDEEVLIGIVARIDPMKDHDTFLRAAAVLTAERSGVRFAIVGAAPSSASLQRLQALAADLGLNSQVLWAGARQDMQAVYSALDVVTSTSAFGEGFSNSLAEAMACERVCVATDVGDARLLLGETGEVVSPAAPQALVAAWSRTLDLGVAGRATRGREARQRVVEHFSVDALVARTSDVLVRLVEGRELNAV